MTLFVKTYFEIDLRVPPWAERGFWPFDFDLEYLGHMEIYKYLVLLDRDYDFFSFVWFGQIADLITTLRGGVPLLFKQV